VETREKNIPLARHHPSVGKSTKRVKNTRYNGEYVIETTFIICSATRNGNKSGCRL